MLCKKVVNFILQVSDVWCLTQVSVWKFRGENFRETLVIGGGTSLWIAFAKLPRQGCHFMKASVLNALFHQRREV